MYLIKVLLPRISAIAAGLFGRYIGDKGAGYITTSCIATTFFLSMVDFYEVGFSGSPCYMTTITWMDSEMFHCSWGFLFDSLTVTMLIVVTGVSSLVH
jgi:NADH-ubiquinone oxidoreductase chain 5